MMGTEAVNHVGAGEHCMAADSSAETAMVVRRLTGRITLYIKPYMPERTTTIRLTDSDQAVLDELQEFTGIQSTTEIIRLALRELARQKGLASAGAQKKSKSPKKA
jgi:hypothetical protein